MTALARTNHGKAAQLVKQPDYFSEFKERPDLAAFLGATILAKVRFLESRGSMLKCAFFCCSLVSQTRGITT